MAEEDVARALVAGARELVLRGADREDCGEVERPQPRPRKGPRPGRRADPDRCGEGSSDDGVDLGEVEKVRPVPPLASSLTRRFSSLSLRFGSFMKSMEIAPMAAGSARAVD